jgi:hypothetical protein
MKTATLNLPTIGTIAATRAILGVGIGLLLSEVVPAERRRPLAFALLGLGVASTVPLVAIVFGDARRERRLTAGS